MEREPYDLFFVHRPLLASLLFGICEQQGIEVRLVSKLKRMAAVRHHMRNLTAR